MDAAYDPFQATDDNSSDGDIDPAISGQVDGAVPHAKVAAREKELPEPAEKRARKNDAGGDTAAAKSSLAGRPWVVRPLAHPLRKTLCAHYLKSDCRWGNECRFAHSADELREGAPVTEGMDFSNLEAGRVSRFLSIPSKLVPSFMTEITRRLLCDASGGCIVTWEPSSSKVCVSGTSAQVDRAEKHIKRALTHCKWGASEQKIHGLLRQRECSSARVRLSPMVTTLKQVDVTLSSLRPQLTMGSGAGNDLTLKGPLISRAHAVLEFIPNKGAVYICDLSTNGTFLNGVPLPAKSSGKVSGKVVLWHGDELLFPEPGKQVKELEYGYMVNLEVV